jgi:hypothetical protein
MGKEVAVEYFIIQLLYNLKFWKLSNYIRRVVHLEGIKLLRRDVEGKIAPLSAV